MEDYINVFKVCRRESWYELIKKTHWVCLSAIENMDEMCVKGTKAKVFVVRCEGQNQVVVERLSRQGRLSYNGHERRVSGHVER